REKVEQGFTYPCFFIRQIQATSGPEFMDRKMRRMHLEIKYFPKICTRRECVRIGELLCNNLKFVGTQHVKDATYVVVDEVLVFTFRLEFRVMRLKERNPFIGPLFINTKVKEE